MKQGLVFVSHHVPGVGMIPAIEPVLCRLCAIELISKPFIIRVYFDQHEIHFEHIECAKREEK